MSKQPSGWAVGWATFAATIMIVAGIFQVIAGIAAVAEDELYVEARDWVFQFDTTTWGWIHIGIGALLVLVGIGIMTGNLAARIVGVVVASLSAIANFAFLPWYPVWGVIMIAVDIAVIWALTAHGRDVEAFD
jgi:hypothetical protein